MKATDITELDHLKAEMKKLIYLFSHDMRNPLVNMKALLNEVHSSLEDVKRGDVQMLDRELPDTLEMLDESVERMSTMIDYANDMYHCMVDPVECESIELKALVKRVLHRFGNIEGVAIRIDEMATLWADPLAVTRIVEVLLKNCLQATGRGTSISVALHRHTDFDELVVTDSGSGQQSAAAGMGLALVKALAEAHGGGVRCESKRGEETTYYVSFPHQEGTTAA